MKTARIVKIIATVICSAFLMNNYAFAYSGGTGEPNDPYQIADINDLLELAADANDYNKCFIMTADIDLDPNIPGNPVFVKPVIAYNAEFIGVFDGAGHKIKNLTFKCNSPIGYVDEFGLFGNVGGGEIKNLGIENLDVNSSSPGEAPADGGGLIRKNGGSDGAQGGSVTNCYVTGNIKCTGGGWFVGLLIGINVGPVSNCYSMGHISVEDPGSEWRPAQTVVAIGGLIGSSNEEISNSWSSASVTAGPSPEGWETSDIGGLVGKGGTLADCYSTGPVTGIGYLENMGGLVGSFGGMERKIKRCFSTSPVTGVNKAVSIGGLVGFTEGNFSIISRCFSTGNVVCGSGSAIIGGLIGDNYRAKVSECVATGSVNSGNGSEGVGGLIGVNIYELNNCYSTGDVNCGDYSTGIGGLVGASGWYDLIKNCYSSGLVAAGDDSTNIGGSIGYDNSINILSTYFLETSGPNNGYGIPLKDEQMKHCNSFVDWDFVGSLCDNGPDYIWFIFEGVNYPQLAWYMGICTIPDVVGLYMSDANDKIIERGFTVGAITYEHSDTVPAGYVISQNPAPGQQDCGSAVSYVVSKGIWPCEIPNIVGLTMPDANSQIIWNGFTVGAISYGYSDTVPAGYVISQNPAAGPSEECDLAISYTASLGPIPSNGRFPDYYDDDIVNFLDFAIFADAWMTEDSLVDLTGDDYVNIYDLKLFCNHWLEEE